MGFAPWFKKPNLMQVAEAQYTRAIPPIMTGGDEQAIGATGISAKVVPAGDGAPEQLQVSAPAELIGRKAGTVYVTSTGSKHTVEHTSLDGATRELQGDERIIALSSIASAVWQERRRQRGSAKS